MKKRLIILTLVVLWCPSVGAWAADQANAVPEMDRVHAWVGTSVQGVGRTLDRFFGAADVFEQSGGSRLDVTVPVAFESTAGASVAVDVDARIALPRTQQRWHLWLQSASAPFEAQEAQEAVGTANTTTQTSPGSARVQAGQASQARQSALGLQTFFESNEHLVSLVDVGLGFDEAHRPSLSAQIESQYLWDLGAWEARTRPAVFWSGEEGGGVRVTQVLSYDWTARHFVRTELRGEAWRDGGAREIAHTWTLYDQISATQGFAYQVSAQWDNRQAGWGLRGFGPEVRWRQRVYRDWLFLETSVFARLRPGTGWEKVEKGGGMGLAPRFY